MEKFTLDVISIISKIPEGKVMTYGQIAKLANHHRGARQVARILHSMSRKYQLPWHRVINAQGEISIKNDALYNDQKLSLESEGVYINRAGKVDLLVYQHHPDETS